jgi:alkylhydroperoxidase family enzyme
VDINSAGGRENGLSHEKIAAVANWRDSDEFSSIERDVLELADAMADAPAQVDEALFHRLQIALGTRGVVELAHAIAWENFRARSNRVFDAQSESYYDGAVCMLPQEAA